jgi:hemolysin III
MNAPEWVVGGAFIGLGTVNAPEEPAPVPAPRRTGTLERVRARTACTVDQRRCGGRTLVIAGGLLYITGAVAYHRRRPDPFPSVFGYHEVFHAFVCAGATCHYVAIALLVG